MERINVDLSLLLLSEMNPRLEASLDENEALSRMIEDQGEKLYVLASDIVEHGLSPLDTIAVFPSENYSGYYEVGEGNRRICALKLLKDPSLLSINNSNLYSKFQELSCSYTVPESIEVGVFESEELLRHWMEIRHMGEQGGKGLSKWNSVQKARFSRIQSGSDQLLDFWDWMVDEGILTKEEIFAVTKTNWQRILREKYFPFLKLQLDDCYSVIQKDMATFTERIRAIQQELQGKTVAIVYDSERIDQFYDSISEKLYGVPYQQIIERESAQVAMTFDSSDDSDSDSIDGDETSTCDDPNSTEDKKHTEPEQDHSFGRDVFNGCRTIIPWSYPIRSSNMRLNKIINELKRLDADVYPNACGTLLRALFELSAKVFMERQDGADHTGTEFDPAIRFTANKLREQGRISNSQHSAILADVDSLRKIFNGYMHDTDGYPSSESIKNFFKCHRVFIEECQK